MKTSRITVNNLEVSFLHKEVESPLGTIIFIHGFPFGKEIWQAQLEALPGKIQGISYDIRGYGESDPGHGYFSIDLFANDLLQFIDQLGLRRVILCGVSMGGYIALRTYELNSSLISALILCDTNASADTNAAKINRFASIEKIRDEGKGAFANDFLKKVFSTATHETQHELVHSIFKLIMALPDATLCATQLALASRTDTSHVLEKINIPTLIIRGAGDQLMSRQQADNLHYGVRDSESVEITEAGHLPNLENPVDFNAVMNRFLERLS
jgi:pimeloyl-ACP methyl ester carboxylesterase